MSPIKVLVDFIKFEELPLSQSSDVSRQRSIPPSLANWSISPSSSALNSCFLSASSESSNRAYDLFLQTEPGNSYASVDEDGWCLSVDTPEKPGKEADAKLDRLKSWLGRHMRTT